MPTPKTLSPSKLAHVVLKTNCIDRQTRFYVNFLGARVVYDGPFMKLLTYDDEHHRIAVVQLPDTTPKDHQSSGLMHIAFTFDTLKDLCEAYGQRKEKGITPGWCVNHGPTTSMYYQDVDGNQLETQVDNMAPEEATAYMETEQYNNNVFGRDFDPEDLCAALERGESEAELMKIGEVGPRGMEAAPEIDAMMKRGTVGV